MYKSIFLITFFFTIAGVAQQRFSVTYNFNNTMAPQVTLGSEAIIAEDAMIGGSKVTNIGFSPYLAQTALSSTITNNNATNYTNSYLRLNIKPKPGYTFVIKSFNVTQASSLVGSSYLFRQGSALNQALPNAADLGSSTGNIIFADNYNDYSFSPSIHVASAQNSDYVTLWLTARGPNTGEFNWYIDKILIEGEYIAIGTESSENVIVSSTLKQKLRFGIDAERLWYWKTGAMGNVLADLGVKELKAEFVRVAIFAAYEREEGVVKPSAYDAIIDMMTAMKTSNPDILFFASPRPLDEAYTPSEEADPAIWNGACPWSPVPTWIIPFTANGTNTDGTTKWKQGTTNVVKLARYYSDYLNFMWSKGFKIDYLDITNETNEITASHCKYLYDNIPLLLNSGVYMPKLVGPSSWSYSQGVTYLNSFTTNQLSSLTIAASHNTSNLGTPESFVNKSVELGKEPWESELHGWVGIDKQQEIINSESFFEHVRAGFVGLDTWLFYGPKEGKDHTMIWSDATSYTKSSKYEIFKKVVNNSNGGNYLETSQSNTGIISTGFMKDGVLMVWVLNKTNFDFPNSEINFGAWNVDGKPIEVTMYRSDLARDGSTSSASTSSGKLNFNIKAASLYCLKIDTVLGLQEVSKDYVTVYPNPTDTVLHISGLTNISSNDSFQIFSSDGRLIDKGLIKESTVNTSNLSSGFYILKIKNNNTIAVSKFLVK